MLRIIPSNGKIIYFNHDKNVSDVIAKGCKAEIIEINASSSIASYDESNKSINFDGDMAIIDNLTVYGEHNRLNTAAAMVCTASCGIDLSNAYKGLKNFRGVLRRLEEKGTFKGITILDDFAHHPTAIKSTINAVKEKYSDKKILNIIELGSNTMSGGFHGDDLSIIDSLDYDIHWLDHNSVLKNNKNNIFSSHEELIKSVSKIYSDFDIILIMTNRDSKNIFEPIKEIIEIS